MSAPMDSQVKKTFARQTDAVEECLIAELNYGQRDCLASQSALANPVASVFTVGYQKLVNNVEIERAKVKALRVKLNAYRKVKIRNADLRDLSAVRDAVNGLGKELDAIAYADELYRAHTEHNPEIDEIYQQRQERLRVIREEVATLTVVTQTADGQRLASKAMSKGRQPHTDEQTMSGKAEVTLAGTVEHVEKAHFPGQREKAEIALGANNFSQDFLIENTLTKESGQEVHLKHGAEVEVRIKAGPEAFRTEK